MKRVSRRDLLRFAASFSGPAALSSLWPSANALHLGLPDRPSFIVLVFDALSASDMSLYGYPRQTTPNFDEFAESALVYHNHRSNGNFTTPGTASLLTGTLPWAHRAINAAGLIDRELASRSFFRALGEEYTRVAYTQNYWADHLLHQFGEDLTVHVPLSEYGAVPDYVIDQALRNDPLAAYRAYESLFFQGSFQNPNSLLLGFVFNLYYQNLVRRATPVDYPLGLPTSNHLHHVYTVESSINGVAREVARLESLGKPYAAYFHLWPPHAPYRPRKEYVGRFEGDDVRPPEKRQHALSTDASPQKLQKFRQEYDAFVAHVDAEFGRLASMLRAAGVLEKTHVIVTSDHGEMFERGTFGHFTPLLYEPVTRIPLLVSVPGEARRRDYFAPTSGVDILPTLLSICGKPIPDWCDGTVLPGLGGQEDWSRRCLAMDAKRSPADHPLAPATFAVVEGGFKLIYYTGYDGGYRERLELYDLEADPEELNDISKKASQSGRPRALREWLLDAIDIANRPYRR